ncbi:MAG: hypothetical protein JWN70_4409 [Planctomycetaceae bacterium]|nr:hypothetical protein [Planctomycetaceae bacterium]
MNASKFKSTITRLATPVTVCVMMCALVAICYFNWPRNTPAGEIIESYGTFRSPHGNGLVTFNSIGTGPGTVTVSANSPNRTPSSTMSFVRAQTWFGAWDDKDRFWTYIEGVGVHVHDEANGISSTTHGAWNGMPPEFLRRLPEAVIQKYQHSM